MLPKLRRVVSFELEATVEGLRRAPNVGRAMLARSLDVDAKTMMALWADIWL